MDNLLGAGERQGHRQEGGRAGAGMLPNKRGLQEQNPILGWFSTHTLVNASIKNKAQKGVEKIQTIDALSICTRMRKGLGYKRNKISEEPTNNQIAEIVKLYSDFEKGQRCKILEKEDSILTRSLFIDHSKEILYKP